MNISVRKSIEHKDGSATCEFVFDKEAHHVLLRHGLVSILLAASSRYKPTDKETKALEKKKPIAKKRSK
jgi:hypothetical protein